MAEPPNDFPILDVTTPFMHGDRVKEAQYLLHHNRHAINFHPGPQDGVYGPETGAASRRAKYWLGYPRKKVDNDFGPHLYSYLLPLGHAPAHRTPMTYRLRGRRRRGEITETTTSDAVWRGAVHEWALSQVGYVETPVNYTKYNDWFYGAHVAAPWCAIFLSYGLNLKGGFKWFHQSYVPTIEQMAYSGYRGMHFIPYSQAKRCDIVTYDWNGDGTADHTEFFGKPISSSMFWAIGGNTGATNWSNGGEVLHVERYLNNVHRIIRIPT